MSELIAHLGLALAWTAIVLLIIARLRRRSANPAPAALCWGAFPIAALLAFLTPTPDFVQSTLADPSAATWSLSIAALLSVAAPARFRPHPKSLRVLLLGIIAGGLFLYPNALGLGDFDIYSWGASGLGLPLTLAIAGFSAWFFDLRLCGIWLLITATFSLTRWHSSPNLWDHLIDLPAFAVAAVLYALALARRKQNHIAASSSEEVPVI